MRSHTGMLRAFLGAAIVAAALVASGCCCFDERPAPEDVTDTPSITIDEGKTDESGTNGYQRVPWSRPLTGLTDDVVEVYRMVGGQPTLRAVFLWKRQNSSESITDERWILRYGESWPLPLGPQDWLVADQSTGMHTVNSMCDAYWSALGYPSKGQAEVHWLNYTPTYIPPALPCNEW